MCQRRHPQRIVTCFLTLWTEVSGQGRIRCVGAFNVVGESRPVPGSLQDSRHQFVDHRPDRLQAEHFLGADDGVVGKTRLVDGLGEDSAFFKSTFVVQVTKVVAAKKNLKDIFI